MKKLLERIVKKKKGVKLGKKLSNNKGFSLIELLIVMAIMGVLAAIAFNMFGGVLDNSKKRADEQMGKNIAQAILTYCVDSGDWDLTAGLVKGTDVISLDDEGIIKDLMQEIKTDVATASERSFGPMLSMKDPNKTIDDDVNIEAYMPQWSKGDNQYKGWKIDIYAVNQSVTVVPTITDGETIVTCHADK